MKKVKLLLLCSLISIANSFAQGVEEGDEMVTPYYGPDLLKGFSNPYSIINLGSPTNYKYSSSGTFGLYSEHMFTDVIGLGVDLFYSKTQTSWTETVETFNAATGMYDTKTYDYKINAPTFAALGRVNFHYANVFSMFSDEFDSYIILAFGYKKTNYKVQTNDPDYQFTPRPSLFSLFNSSSPIGGKVGAGFRYFFTDEAAINIEVTAGQPLISGGLTYRFQ